VTAREAAALLVVVALLGYVGVVMPRRAERLLAALRQRIAADPAERFRFYLRYLRMAAVGVAVYAATAWLGGHGAAVAGAGWSDRALMRLFPGLLLSGVVLDAGLLALFVVGRRRDPEAMKKENQYARVEFLVPSAPRERRMWPLVCLAIAVVEECVYRGLFVLYAARLLDLSPWWLVVPTSLVFGVAHAYQGWLGIAATTVMGAAFAVVTVVTGSLLPAVVLHLLFDLRLAYVKRPGPAAPGPGGDSALPPEPLG